MNKTSDRRLSTPKTWTREWSPARHWLQDDNAPVLDRGNSCDEEHRRPGRVERSSWHDEGVVSDDCTD